jgi:hypothetical protein
MFEGEEEAKSEMEQITQVSLSELRGSQPNWVQVEFDTSEEREYFEIMRTLTEPSQSVEAAKTPEAIGSKKKKKLCWRTHWGFIPLFMLVAIGVAAAVLYWTMEEETVEPEPMVRPSTGFRATAMFEATYRKTESKSWTPTPGSSMFKRRLECLPECEQLSDVELLMDAMETICGIQDENSGDCMNMLWCIACRA